MEYDQVLGIYNVSPTCRVNFIAGLYCPQSFYELLKNKKYDSFPMINCKFVHIR